MDDESEALYRAEHAAHACAILSRVPRSEIQAISDRGARMRQAHAAYLGRGTCEAHGLTHCACTARGSAEPHAATLATAYAALPYFSREDFRDATAHASAEHARGTGKAYRYALDPACSGALYHPGASVRTPDRTHARRERAEHAAIEASERLTRARAALARLRAAWKGARTRKEREAARSRYRAACHRLGIRPE